MGRDLRIGRCKKFEYMTCPYKDRPEMKGPIRILRQDGPGDLSGGFDPIRSWEELYKANNKFCVSCDQFEDLLKEE
jgi:hypothetical protein